MPVFHARSGLAQHRIQKRGESFRSDIPAIAMALARRTEIDSSMRDNVVVVT